MVAQELRIGNFTKQGEIKTFWEKGVHVGFGKCYEFNEIEPLPLTEEWLLKFGFERIFKSSNLFLDLTKDIYLFWYNNELNGCVKNHYMDSDNQLPELEFDLNIKSVHQLQNLYFALTNQELTLKQI